MIMEERFTSLENYNQKDEILWFNQKENTKNFKNYRTSFYGNNLDFD